jgi:hypothetical protein
MGGGWDAHFHGTALGGVPACVSERHRKYVLLPDKARAYWLATRFRYESSVLRLV